jgi:hypothetical protein
MYENEGVSSVKADSGPTPIRKRRGTKSRVNLIVDRDTKEVKGVYIEGSDKPPHPSDWVRILLAGAEYAASRPELAPEFRVFLTLLTNIQFGNFSRVSQAEMAGVLGVSQAAVGRAVKKFIEIGLIQRDRVSGVTGYRFNPNIAHRGDESKIPVANAIYQAKRASDWQKRKDAEEAQRLAVEASAIGDPTFREGAA